MIIIVVRPRSGGHCFFFFTIYIVYVIMYVYFNLPSPYSSITINVISLKSYTFVLCVESMQMTVDAYR